MISARIQSDYDRDTSLFAAVLDDGDCVFRSHGNGEMRVATSGGQFHGDQLVFVCSVINRLVDDNCVNGLSDENRKKGDVKDEVLEDTGRMEMYGGDYS